MSKIPWTQETFNPVVGCSKVSPGCKNCYAEPIAKRFWKKWGLLPPPHHFGVKWYPERLDKPLHWKKPRKIFVCSMGDLFHPSVPFEFIDKVINVFEICKQHTGQILTKRHERLLEYDKHRNHKWPDNIIGMVSCENQKYADLRIPYLLQCGFKTTGVSLEPLLGPIDISWWLKRHMVGRIRKPRYTDILDWVIIGAESKGAYPGRRCKREWIDNIVEQCKSAKVPCFVKQVHECFVSTMELIKDPDRITKNFCYPQQYPKGEPK